MPIQTSVAKRFWSHAKPDVNGCMIWQGKCETFSYRCVNHPITRFALLLAAGTWPAHRLQVIRSCGVPRCVNPEHLFIGTSQDCKKLLYAQVVRPYKYTLD